MFRFRTVCFSFCLASLVAAVCAQTIRMDEGRVGLPTDWSHRHVIFPNPANEEQRRILDADPRYAQQVERRTFLRFAPEKLTSGLLPRDTTSSSATTDRDWNEAVGTSTFTINTAPIYPAKYSFNVANPSPSCTNDYVVYTLPTSGGGSSFNIVAYNNLYVNTTNNGFCAGTTPKVLFSYNASQNRGNLSTSPVLSLDGTKIAFLEQSSPAQFHVLKWVAGNYNSTFPVPYNSAALSSCTTASAPCEFSVTLSNTATISAPFIDYTSDTAYVTDSKGKLYAIHPVFTATSTAPPALVTGYPVTVSANQLTSPVYDSVSGNVFVSDTLSLYYVRTKSTSSGACASGTTTPCLGKTSQVVSASPANGTQLEAPIVDSTNGTVFAFASSGGSTNYVEVVQSNTTLSLKNVAKISGSAGGVVTSVFTGTFNNAYYNSPTTGLLYACGENGSHIPALWALSFSSATTMNTTAAAGPLSLATATISGSNPGCSSLTEVYNQTAAKDYLFVGVPSSCAFSGSSTGCVLSFDITSGFPTNKLATFGSKNGTSGIVIDDVSGSVTSATNLYFLTGAPQGTGSACNLHTTGTNTTGNCAIKLTQSLLN